MRTCPACAEEIQDGALRCRFCGTDLTSPFPPEPMVSPEGAAPTDARGGVLAVVGTVLLFIATLVPFGSGNKLVEFGYGSRILLGDVIIEWVPIGALFVLAIRSIGSLAGPTAWAIGGIAIALLARFIGLLFLPFDSVGVAVPLGIAGGGFALGGALLSVSRGRSRSLFRQ